MEGLFTNNIFFVYLLGVLVIINYEAFEKKQKIAIIYVCSFGLTFNDELHWIVILGLLIFVLFLYEEYLNEDLTKIKYVKRFRYKLLDFIYMYIFQYKILYIIAAVCLRFFICSTFYTELFKKSSSLATSLRNVVFIMIIILLILGIHNMFTNPIELKNFKQIDQKFSEYPYYLLPLRNEEKREALFERLELVADIEDYTFFLRKKSYSCFSLEFLRIVYHKKKNKKVHTGTKKTYWTHEIWFKFLFVLEKVFHFIKTGYKKKALNRIPILIYEQICISLLQKGEYVKRKMKRYARGYSTIEMQLIRILAYSKGLKMGRPQNFEDLYLIFTRKIFEILYAPIFFAGHKKI